MIEQLCPVLLILMGKHIIRSFQTSNEKDMIPSNKPENYSVLTGQHLILNIGDHRERPAVKVILLY